MTKYYHHLLIFIVFAAVISCSSDKPTYYNLTVIATPSESGTVNPASGEFERGSEVEITATANENWRFDSWHGDHSGSSPVTTVTMDSSMVIGALFVEQDYPITIHVEGEGRVSQQVVSSKTDYPHGTTVELTAEPDHGWYFSHWEGDLDSDENPETITVENEIEITVIFERLDFPLTIHVEGDGSVSQQVVEQPKSTDYIYETVIELHATPETGWVFSRWEGDVESTNNIVEITIDEEKEVTAVFEENDYTLTVLIEGEGEVAQTLIGAKQTDYPFGSSVSLEAFAAENWGFSHWNEDEHHTDNPIVVTVRQDTTITANFSLAPSVTTKEVTAITDSSAVSGGTITNDGGFTITARGVCFDTSASPGLDNTCTNNGTGDGEFDSLISGLEAETDYYVRAYATYSGRTVYGNQASFTSETAISVPGAPLITDVIAGDGEITVHFEAPEEDGGSPITHYEYRLDFITGDPDVDIGLDSPFTIREGENDGGGHYQIINGEEYIVRLRAVNAAGPGERVSSDPVTPLPLIHLGDNGVTVMCPIAPVGYRGMVDGVEYEVVDRELLEQRLSEDADATVLCTSLVTDMSELHLHFLPRFNQPIGNWDVRNVINMSQIFAHAELFNQDISQWDVSNVTDMSYMFAFTERFNQPIGEWDVSNVTDMSWMFAGFFDDNEDLSAFDQDISEWDVSNVKNMQGMFSGSGFNQDISEWDVSSVTNMSSMFSRAVNYNQDLSEWCVRNIISKPVNFDEGADEWILPRPVWGTCPE